MSRLNHRAQAPKVYTHEGAPAYPHLNDVQRLRRAVFACFLWEKQFYEDGVEIAERISELARAVAPETLAEIAFEARNEHNLRHVPLLLLRELVRTGAGLVAQTIYRTVQRADELAELLALYWATNDGKKTLSAQLKKGLAAAYTKFDAYQLAKYDRPNAVKLRDVLFLSHAKPLSDEQAAAWGKLIEGTLESPDTWEVNLSAGKDKKETFERLIQERKLGYFALLRNLRNMEQAGVDQALVREAILARHGGAHRVLPFRYIAAAKAAPKFEPELDGALLSHLQQEPKLPGKTIVVVDVSGSMNFSQVSHKSDMTRMSVACALGAIAREMCEQPVIYATAGSDARQIHATQEVPPRRGMALAEAIGNMCRPLGGGGIFLNQVVNFLEEREKNCDRMIVITDEQDCAVDSKDRPDLVRPFGRHNYLINVASNKNGIGYGKWTHLDGFSEAVFRYFRAYESL